MESSTPFAATEVAVYNSEDGSWYRLGDEPWKIRDTAKGQPAHVFVRVDAASYDEAFEKLFGHAAPRPTLKREAKRVTE